MASPRTITLGDHRVNRIGLGTNRLTDTRENRDFLRHAVEAGVELIDTAHLYGGGASERAIGAALAPFPDGLVVATKGGYHPGGRRARAAARRAGAEPRATSGGEHRPLLPPSRRPGGAARGDARRVEGLRGASRAPLERIAARYDATPQQIMLAWFLERSPGLAPIPGTLSFAHLEENLSALDLELSEADHAAIGR